MRSFRSLFCTMLALFALISAQTTHDGKSVLSAGFTEFVFESGVAQRAAPVRTICPLLTESRV